MNTITTTEYPTRYVAFDNRHHLVRHEQPTLMGGFEAAVYSRAMENVAMPWLTDGPFGEVVYHGGRGVWTATVHGNMPDASRKQHSKTDYNIDRQRTLPELIEWMRVEVDAMHEGFMGALRAQAVRISRHDEVK